MKITPIKTYFELSRVVNFLTKIIEDNKLNIDRDFVSLVALNCSGIKNKDLEESVVKLGLSISKDETI